MEEPLTVAMIGIKAIPARFGGFETAVDELSRGLVKLGHHVRVYNRSGMATWPGENYEGVTLVTLPTLRAKNLSTIVHAFLATLHVLFHPVEVVHYFTTGVTLFAPLPRLLGMKVVCSVDGIDWQRGKWGNFARWYLKSSERLAVWWCHGLVADSQDIMRYYSRKFGVSSSLITYGTRELKSQGHEWLDRFGLESRQYVLFVGRLVPENNIHHLIKAFEPTKTSKRLVIVGDDPWERGYIRSLKSTTDPRVVFTGGVYEEGYEQLQRNAYLFVLPDEVGGTHPALVEAMGFGNCPLVNDTPSNLEVIGDAGFSYRGGKGAEDLQKQLQMLVDCPQLVQEYREKASQRARIHYRWEDVVRAHQALYQHVVGGKSLTAQNNKRSSAGDGRGPTKLVSRGPEKDFANPQRSQYSDKLVPASCKRCLDACISAVLLVLLAPLLAALAVGVKLTSRGPVLYKWEVVGKGGRPFTGYKFRSMRPNSDELRKQLEPLNEMHGPVFKLTNDPRITKFGAWMRRYSLDELPQLWSVLKGNMSLVGPRPPLASEYVRFTDYQRQKLSVKPGITCLWQVTGRNNIKDFDEWVKLDLEYIRKQSFWLDIKILLKTLPAVLGGTGR
jgi:lipopolysaccharide/colanic/teichoic acid biosynthesis glycosyltransferase/glycosyltransferase involved in cell wall biosynthesis